MRMCSQSTYLVNRNKKNVSSWSDTPAFLCLRCFFWLNHTPPHTACRPRNMASPKSTHHWQRQRKLSWVSCLMCTFINLSTDLGKLGEPCRVWVCVRVRWGVIFPQCVCDFSSECVCDVPQNVCVWCSSEQILVHPLWTNNTVYTSWKSYRLVRLEVNTLIMRSNAT